MHYKPNASTAAHLRLHTATMLLPLVVVVVTQQKLTASPLAAPVVSARTRLDL